MIVTHHGPVYAERIRPAVKVADEMDRAFDAAAADAEKLRHNYLLRRHLTTKGTPVERAPGLDYLTAFRRCFTSGSSAPR